MQSKGASSFSTGTHRIGGTQNNLLRTMGSPGYFLPQVPEQILSTEELK